MELFKKRLPQNGKETVLFMLIISVISINIIAPIITGLEIGFSVNHWLSVFPQLPMLWASVILLVVLTQKPTEMLSKVVVGHEPNSFRATMLINALCNVFLMSLVLTVVGAWIGTQHISMEPIHHFFLRWPRNFTIAFIVEAFIAQPIARYVMQFIHRKPVKA